MNDILFGLIVWVGCSLTVGGVIIVGCWHYDRKLLRQTQRELASRRLEHRGRVDNVIPLHPRRNGHDRIA